MMLDITTITVSKVVKSYNGGSGRIRTYSPMERIYSPPPLSNSTALPNFTLHEYEQVLPIHPETFSNFRGQLQLETFCASATTRNKLAALA